ncbi:hypothetical protein PHMEG_00010152 [Phytophthora megakarya]|uniref:Uncharacterized protein n=1 Tax=Phytophthora megakarya TaxID=4795 RepID=A0A225WEE3_9STRA|nr:hypothetical protein PHMEG_00010152 [Phytophthora megakarya]
MHVKPSSPGLTRMSTDDVNGAFRNIPVAADRSGRFPGAITELDILVIDLSCSFGWTDSPRQYWVAEALLSIYIRAPALSGQVNQATVRMLSAGKHDIGSSRLEEVSLLLRTAMVTILCPYACNNDKFTPWFTDGKALGLQ